MDVIETVLACPECSHPYSHIRRVYTLQGTDPQEAGVIEGTRVWGQTPERRSALAIEIDGECGHAWEMRIQQHKGHNLLSVRPTI